MIRRPPRSTRVRSSAASDVYKRQLLRPFRMGRLRRAAREFFASSHDDMHRDYTEFCIAENEWLADYAIFMTLAELENCREWSCWPIDLAHREPQAIQLIEKNYS